MNIPVVGWHLKMLEEFNFIIHERLNGHEAYFHSSITNDNRKILFFLSKEKPKQIIEFLVRNRKGFTKTDLSKELKMSRNTIKKYIEKIYELKLLQIKIISNKTLYFLKQEAYDLILKKLV